MAFVEGDEDLMSRREQAAQVQPQVFQALGEYGKGPRWAHGIHDVPYGRVLRGLRENQQDQADACQADSEQPLENLWPCEMAAGTQ